MRAKTCDQRKAKLNEYTEKAEILTSEFENINFDNPPRKAPTGAGPPTWCGSNTARSFLCPVRPRLEEEGRRQGGSQYNQTCDSDELPGGDLEMMADDYSKHQPAASPQQDDLRLSGPPSGQGAGGATRIRNRGVRADIRAGSLSTEPPIPMRMEGMSWME
ncbi:hypothetical protein PoB_000993300 [Plakobranchus ocellatus]|uniref:Uncharacterized protein n=1 Tax=Plakobranchus ocellatus TaxID=259542 RepID=A0AAV3YM54_9GAST|nr:hypothetical protein PoB_000993300 [Plakobranchus ocellatus]